MAEEFGGDVDQDKALATQVYAAFNETFRTGDGAALARVFANDVVDHNPVHGQRPGIAGIVWFCEAYRAGFPDAHFTIEDLIAEGQTVVARLEVHGTNTGTFQGMPPTGKRIAMSAIDILRIEGGRVVELWGDADEAGLMRQLGPAGGPSQGVGPRSPQPAGAPAEASASD